MVYLPSVVIADYRCLNVKILLAVIHIYSLEANSKHVVCSGSDVWRRVGLLLDESSRRDVADLQHLLEQIGEYQAEEGKKSQGHHSTTTGLVIVLSSVAGSDCSCEHVDFLN